MARREGAYEQLEQRARQLQELGSILHCLSWDQETMMPSRGVEPRAQQIATLSTLFHQKITDPVIGRLLEEIEESGLDVWQRATAREVRRNHQKAVRLPEALVRELAETTTLAYEAWVKARKESDFAAFAPWLEKIVRLKREEARCLQSGNSLYEALLDDYEPGMSTSRLYELFAFVQPRLTKLLTRIQSSGRQPPADLLHGKYPQEQQQAFGREVLDSMGFDWQAGRLDVSPHPFCTGLSPLDVRITTRYSEEDFASALFGIIHEGGHALYEQGLDARKYGSPACDAISLGIHESQSRLWENQIGRSRFFWAYWFPRLKAFFPGQLENVNSEDFIRAINRVEASLIRVEADEVSYGLHIILRFELEKSLIEDDLITADLEEVWKDKMKEYLGITPSRAADGVLQDTHWSQGLLGYFPTYLLGNLYASQIYNQARKSIPDLEKAISEGRLIPLREWLRKHVHQRGKTVSAEELLREITRNTLQPNHFIDYLEQKFGELYQL